MPEGWHAHGETALIALSDGSYRQRKGKRYIYIYIYIYNLFLLYIQYIYINKVCEKVMQQFNNCLEE